MRVCLFFLSCSGGFNFVLVFLVKSKFFVFEKCWGVIFVVKLVLSFCVKLIIFIDFEFDKCWIWIFVCVW